MISRTRSTRTAAVLMLTAIAMALLAGACSSDDDDPEPAATTAATEPAATATQTTDTAPAPGGFTTIVAADAGDLGTILTTFDGYTLYTFKNDVAFSGTSACEGGCAAAWPPLTFVGEPSAGEGLTGELGEATRSDGTKQMSYNGMPLYLFASDAAPGDTNGQGVGEVWFVAQP